VARLSRELGALKNLSGKVDEAARLARVQPYGAKVGRADAVPVHRIDRGSVVNAQGAKEYAHAHGGRTDGYKPPHVPEKSVVLTDLPKDTKFVHVFSSDATAPKDLKSDAVGEWVMPKSEITKPDGSLMSGAEIQQKFSLPKMPTYIVDVKPDRAVRATVSRVAGTGSKNGGIANHFGEGGGQQWKIQENLEGNKNKYKKWFQNVRPLDGGK